MTGISVRSNAYDPSSGLSAEAEISLESDRVKRLALSRGFQAAHVFMAPTDEQEPSLDNPLHTGVGWGLVVNEALDPLPESLRQLVEFRKGGVYLYCPKSEHSLTQLIGATRAEPVSVFGSAKGTGPKCLPFYLLIYGSPNSVPWSLQFNLGSSRCVGRLSLVGEALENYVAALLGDFAMDASDPYSALVWAVDFGPKDITSVLRNQIAEKVDAAIRGDPEMKCTFIDGTSSKRKATGEQLVEALNQERPGLIVTTSHGQTGPRDDESEMRRTLGTPLDQNHGSVDPDMVLNTWKPGGAIWFCHACCSAGSDAPSSFASLFGESTDMHHLLKSVAALGPAVAPLPERLLGAKSPLRAFVGHVEPTFDFTLESPFTGQSMTSALVSALYPSLFRRKPRMPLGFAFREWHASAHPMFVDWDREKDMYDGSPAIVGKLLVYQLAIRDIQGTVILGDPAVLVPLRSA